MGSFDETISFVCMLKNDRDVSTAHARARKLLLTNTEEGGILFPSSAGLVAATGAGRHESFLQSTPMEKAERNSPRMLQAGVPRAAIREGFQQMGGPFCAAHHGDFPSFPQQTSQQALPREIVSIWLQGEFSQKGEVR